MTPDHAFVPNTWPKRDECDRKTDEGDGKLRQCGRPRKEHLTLVCAKCGDEPSPDEARYTAKVGGTHWKRKYRDGVVGMKGCDSASSCGPWVSAELVAEQRREKLDEWRRAKAHG